MFLLGNGIVNINYFTVIVIFTFHMQFGRVYDHDNIYKFQLIHFSWIITHCILMNIMLYHYCYNDHHLMMYWYLQEHMILFRMLIVIQNQWS